MSRDTENFLQSVLKWVIIKGIYERVDQTVDVSEVYFSIIYGPTEAHVKTKIVEKEIDLIAGPANYIKESNQEQCSDRMSNSIVHPCSSVVISTAFELCGILASQNKNDPKITIEKKQKWEKVFNDNCHDSCNSLYLKTGPFSHVVTDLISNICSGYGDKKIKTKTKEPCKNHTRNSHFA